MYPNYYGSQLNTIIDYQQNLYLELESVNSNLSIVITGIHILVFIFVLSITIGFVRKIFAVGR